MTAKELIRILKDVPDDTKVHVYIDKLKVAPEVIDTVNPEYNDNAIFLLVKNLS